MTLFDWLIPGILVILGLREFLPRAVRLFRPKLHDIYFEEDSNLEISDTNLREDVDTLVDKLKSLGFSPIGVRVEKPPLWGPAMKELTLVSVSANTFACVYVERKIVKYYYYTPFSSGEIVISAYATYKNVDKNELKIYRANRNEPGEIFSVHKKNVEEFIGNGYTPYKEYTWQSRLKASYLYYNSPQIKKAEVRGDVISLAILVVCFLPLILALVSFMRQAPPVPPA